MKIGVFQEMSKIFLIIKWLVKFISLAVSKINVNMYKTVILILFVVLSNCNNKEKHELKNSDFTNFISQLKLVDIERNELFSDFDVYPSKMRLIGDSVFVVTTTTPEWGVYLIDFSGKLLSKYVKPLGNGPGQVQVINDVSVSSDQKVLLLDKLSNELETFQVTDDHLDYVDTIVLPNYYPYSMHTYVNVSGKKFGIFRNLSEKYEIKDNTICRSVYYLFSLNSDHSINRKVTEFIGNEVIENVVPGTVIDNPIGFRTSWQFAGSKMYYTSNESFNLTSIDLETLEQRKYSFNPDGMPERFLQEDERKYLENKFSLFIERIPAFKENFEERDSMPLFYEFGVYQNHVYYQIQNYSENEEVIVQVNIDNGDMKKINATPGFVMFGISDNEIFGIDYLESKSVPKILYLSP